MNFEQADPETALKKFQELFDRASSEDDIDSQRLGLHGKGLAYSAMNRSAEALRAAGELRKITEGSLNKKAIWLYFHLMGTIELKQRNFGQAIENLEKALRLMSFETTVVTVQALFFDPLAQAYLEAGQQEKALATYRRSPNSRAGDSLGALFMRRASINWARSMR